MRCLTLAGMLREKGAEVTFVSREQPGHLAEHVRRMGHRVHLLPPAEQPASGWLGVSWEQDADETRQVLPAEGIEWLVVDHYGLDQRWEAALHPSARRLLVVDDLADRPHDCDLLLDQNLCAGMETRYQGLVPAGCRLLLGPRYALLRPEFREARKGLGPRSGHVSRILVFFGGADADNQTEKALDALAMLGTRDLAIDVVVGASNPHQARIGERCALLAGATLHVATPHMATLMAQADLAIGAGGTTTWERCYLGLPSLILTLADNQVPLVAAVAAQEAAWNLGPAEAVSAAAIRDQLVELLADPARVANAARRALDVMAGNGEQTVADWMWEAAGV